METFNLFDGETDTGPDGKEPPGYRGSVVQLGPKLGASLLGMSIYDLPPGEAICPYHFEWTDEEWLIVVAGSPTIRTPEGEVTLGPGDVACSVRAASHMLAAGGPHALRGALANAPRGGVVLVVDVCTSGHAAALVARAA